MVDLSKKGFIMSILIRKDGKEFLHRRLVSRIRRTDDGLIYDSDRWNHRSIDLEDGHFIGGITLHGLFNVYLKGPNREVVKAAIDHLFEELKKFLSNRNKVIDLSTMTFECDCIEIDE